MRNRAGYSKRSRRSLGLRRRFTAAALLCAGVLAAVWGLGRRGPHAESAPGLPIARAATKPPPSAQPWTTGDVRALRTALQSALQPGLKGAAAWSLAVAGADGRSLYGDRAARAVAPASVTKLIVAATALDVLGQNFRYHTIFAGSQSIGANGTLDGDLWLAGSGDPSLRGDDVQRGVGVLARSGLRAIDGALAVDPSAMRGPGLNPHWSPDDEGQDYAAPTNALSIDGDTIETRTTVGGVRQRFWTPIKDVPQYVADAVQTLLHRRGIATAKPPRIAPAPLDSVVLWDHPSPALSELERHMLVYSDNHYAEQLLRTLGGEVSVSADDAGGLEAERTFLSERGIPTPGLRLFDGSGLSDGDRVAAVTFVRLLSDADARSTPLYRLLPLGGREGTLSDYPFTSALGRVRAKSGHLSDVSALSGYVNTRRHGRVAFAFLIDGSRGDPDTAIVRAVDAIAEF